MIQSYYRASTTRTTIKKKQKLDNNAISSSIVKYEDRKGYLPSVKTQENIISEALWYRLKCSLKYDIPSSIYERPIPPAVPKKIITFKDDISFNLADYYEKEELMKMNLPEKYGKREKVEDKFECNCCFEKLFDFLLAYKCANIHCLRHFCKGCY